MPRLAWPVRERRARLPRPQLTNVPYDGSSSPDRRVSRRTALFSTLGVLAAGVLAGIGLDRLGRGSSAEQPSLVERGRWVDVAGVAEVPNGAVRPFTADAVQGFLINHGGNYRALSRLCTHLGCTLGFDPLEQSFMCPCHGAEFGLNGRQRFGATQFRLSLPPLPEIRVRVRGSTLQVWTA